ncbi:hypothetical protein GWI33_016843 [Rhynchophorus ferrugineus]|uniref:Uncharacterized protein n=1 Tax=Rhynchophorus ferrugineus TaxID=354439 RepID=A0A834HWM6_RHYFE|nr:hypothetical protein GWI33_016843 [Rhynchophorus ferrugineus]
MTSLYFREYKNCELSPYVTSATNNLNVQVGITRNDVLTIAGLAVTMTPYYSHYLTHEAYTLKSRYDEKNELRDPPKTVYGRHSPILCYLAIKTELPALRAHKTRSKLQSAHAGPHHANLVNGSVRVSSSHRCTPMQLRVAPPFLRPQPPTSSSSSSSSS